MPATMYILSAIAVTTILLVWCTGPVLCVDISVGIFYTNNSGEWGYWRTAAAVTMAKTQLRLDGVLQDDVNITFMVEAPLEGTDMFYAGKASEFYGKGVDVIIGPSWSPSAVAVGYLCTYWNLPFMNWGAVNTVFRDKTKFTTLVRIMNDATAFPMALERIFIHYKWRTYAKIIEDRVGGGCNYYDLALIKAIRDPEYTLIEQEQYYLNTLDVAIDDQLLDERLREIKLAARIIVLCTSNFTAERHIILRAHKLGMTTGEYVWLTPSSRVESSLDRPWYLDTASEEENNMAREAYRVVFDITYSRALDLSKEMKFREELPYRMAEPPWNFPETLRQNLTGSNVASYVYDVMYTYGLLLNITFERNLDYRDGELLFNLARGLQFQGMTGKVYIDDLGDRRPDFWLWDMNETTGYRQLSAMVSMTGDDAFDIVNEPDWNNDLNTPPPDEPVCGFRNEYCPPDYSARNTLIIVIIILLVLTGICAAAFAYYRKQRQLEDELSRMLWKVDYNDITLHGHKAGLGSQLSFYSQNSKGSSAGSMTYDQKGQFFTQLGVFRGQQVAIKRLFLEKVEIKKADLLELKEMRDLTHENINQFVGMCVDPPEICTLFSYCSKGSLMDLLENEDIKLDNVFKISMMQDLCNGLQHLHNSWFRSHGLLKSTNCVVDSRWMLKITDFGLPHLMAASNTSADLSEYQKYRKLWWTSPELLRTTHPKPRGTQKGDIYSFGVIVYEIAFRKSPYTTDTLTPKDHVDRVIKQETPPYRPALEEEPFHEKVKQIMKECWREDPDDRPDVHQVKKLLKKLNQGKKLNLMDHMLGLMEKYANNLEELVEQRTKELFTEKKKTDMLLYRMLPALVADRLKLGETVAPEEFDDVTIYFSDIVGFTTISAASTPFQLEDITSTTIWSLDAPNIHSVRVSSKHLKVLPEFLTVKPMEVVDLLNDLYTMFDNCLSRFDVYKVETIGDAYMVVSGLPKRNGTLHAGQIADMALDLLDAVLTFQIRHMPEVLLMIRIGMHTGPCCAGVVGLSMPRYCLFGDTVNMASRMESNGAGLKIHISETCEAALGKLEGYKTELRGEMDIKGKGVQKTYWLVGKENHKKRLPTEHEVQFDA